jgi:hypothetical protein
MRPVLPESPGPASRGKSAAPADSAPGAGGHPFRLASISPADAPSGCVGADWLIYRIAQGDNTITGYRRGELAVVRADVQKIVEDLNERRRTLKKSTGLRPGRPSAAAVAARQRNDADE